MLTLTLTLTHYFDISLYCWRLNYTVIFAYSVRMVVVDPMPMLTGDHATQLICLTAPCYPTNHLSGELVLMVPQ